MGENGIGERIAQIRRIRSLTQEELAERAQVSIATVTKLEQGQRGGARIATIHAIARALGVETSALFGSASDAGETSEHETDFTGVRRLLEPSLGATASMEVPTLEGLRRDVRTVTELYHQTRLARTLASLPLVVGRGEALVDAAEGERHDTAARLLSHAYLVIAYTLIQFRKEDLAFEATRRSMARAHQVGDRILHAAGADALGWILQRQARFDDAERTVLHVSEQIEPSLRTAAPEHLAVWGRLLTRGAASAARNNRPAAASDYLSMARAAATRLGEDHMTFDAYWGSFGPTTVASIAVENAMTVGDPERALHLAERVTFTPHVRLSTWTRHLLTVAEARTATRNYKGAIASLVEARDKSPEWIKHQRLAKHVVRDLLDVSSVRQAKSSGLANLAAHLGVQPEKASTSRARPPTPRRSPNRTRTDSTPLEEHGMGIGEEIRARRYGGERISAQHVFTNRVTEKEAFDRKLDEIRELNRADPDNVLDFGAPRRNLLTFYGHGGVGKTSLSLELERLFLAETTGKVRRHTVRVDFSEPSARDPEIFLLSLRAGLAPLESFPAFDTAFALYWARQNPGTPLAGFVSQQTALGTVAQRDKFARDLVEFTQGVVDSAGLVVGGASRAAKFAWRWVKDTMVVRGLRRDCPFFEFCATEEDVEQLRLHLPLLLAWDLMQLRRKKDLDVVVFLDTFEHVTNGRRAARLGDLEDAVSRCVYFMPNVLFTLTSRNNLDWSSELRSPSLEYHGSAVWPGLALNGHGDQHRVGSLSQQDCEQYLLNCLLDADGKPVIPPPLRAAIARMSDGLPLYLDVASNHYRSVVARGRTPTAADFSGGLPQVVLRLMEDLDDAQSDLLRAAALLHVFDRDTLKATLPNLRSSAVEQFLDRSLVLKREDNFFSVHELLQTSVRLQDSFTSNPWSDDEWSEVGDRLVAYWSQRFDDPDSLLWRDRRTQALAFWQLVGLYATTDVAVPRIADLVMQVQMKGVWATIDAGRDQPDALLTDRGRSLLRLLDGMMERQIGDLERVVTLLEPFTASADGIDEDARRLALYYLGETYDLRGGDPQGTFLDIARRDDRLGTEALIALAHSKSRDGDQAGALEIARRFDPDARDGEFRYRVHELLGHIWWCSGVFDKAADHFLVTKHTAEEHEAPLLLALARRHLCLVWCWDNPALVLDEVDDVEQLNRDLGLPPGIAQCQMARATALVGRAPLDEVDAMLATADETFATAGYVDDAVGPVAVRVFAAAVNGDLDLARQRRQELAARAEGRRVRHWLAAADAWTAELTTAAHVTWPDGAEQGAAAWSAPLLVRRTG